MLLARQNWPWTWSTFGRSVSLCYLWNFHRFVWSHSFVDNITHRQERWVPMWFSVTVLRRPWNSANTWMYSAFARTGLSLDCWPKLSDGNSFATTVAWHPSFKGKETDGSHFPCGRFDGLWFHGRWCSLSRLHPSPPALLPRKPSVRNFLWNSRPEKALLVPRNKLSLSLRQLRTINLRFYPGNKQDYHRV